MATQKFENSSAPILDDDSEWFDFDVSSEINNLINLIFYKCNVKC
jgi:hypothetical protein